MYCVFGEKILKCEVVERLEESSWCKIGTTTKNKSISNNKLFKSEEEARSFLKKQKYEKAVKESKIVDEVHECKVLYDDFFNETGIVVRVIDRRFKVKEVESQLMHLRKKYNKSEDAVKSSPESPKDSRAYSNKGATPSGKKFEEDIMPKRSKKNQEPSFIKHMNKSRNTFNKKK